MRYDSELRNEEKIIYALRRIYHSYGYKQYRMSKFEDYDFYAKNKDFLVSDNIISFTDTNGRLMALKPDVTLSIVRNINDELKQTQKLYYNENVYRVSKKSNSFRELMQVGLECIGAVDTYSINEVITLAALSLKSISDSSILTISHMGIIENLLDRWNCQRRDRQELLRCIAEKNRHEAAALLDRSGADEALKNDLLRIMGIHNMPGAAYEELKGPGIASDILSQLKSIIDLAEINGISDMLRFDFSIINDTNYYNGIVFYGFVEGIPLAVLAGGQYDRLMSRLKKKTSAIGFAVYMDRLERLYGSAEKYDIDSLILYDDATDITELNIFAKKMYDEGRSFMLAKSVPEGLKYKQLLNFDKNDGRIC